MRKELVLIYDIANDYKTLCLYESAIDIIETLEMCYKEYLCDLSRKEKNELYRFIKCLYKKDSAKCGKRKINLSM
jgi:hypothetical protein